MLVGQLPVWFEKNKPETALPRPTTFVMNMMLGDIIEAIFKGILREAKVEYQDSERITLPLKNADIDGTYDLIIDEAVDDVKSDLTGHTSTSFFIRSAERQ